MKKLIGNRIIQTSVFISGKGTNLKNLIIFSKKKKLDINIKTVVANTKKASGIIHAKRSNIQINIVNFSNENSVRSLLNHLNKNNIKLICLAGFMKILSKNFINSFNGKIINIHPSLLPKYKGLNTHKKVIENKEKYTGCTVHFVNSKLDDGKIILQKKIKVLKKDNVNSLKNRVLKEEHLLYPRSIKKVISNF